MLALDQNKYLLCEIHCQEFLIKNIYNVFFITEDDIKKIYTIELETEKKYKLWGLRNRGGFKKKNQKREYTFFKI